MIDRQMLGDIGLAILIALPTAAFARPEPVVSDKIAVSPVVEQAAAAERTAPERRVGLPS